MFIPRHETKVLQEKLNQAIQNGIGSTILISGEPGIGKTTLIKNFMDNCDATSEKNVLTAVGSCLDMDGVSRGFLPWREVLIELDADKAAGKDEEKKTNFKKIVKTVFDEAGSQWLEAIPVIGDISSAIFETAKTISKDELIDVETGDTKKLALKDRLKNVAKECTGEWLNVIPVVGNLSAAIYKTTNAIQKSKQMTYSQNQQDFFIRVMSRFRELAENNPVIIYIDDLQWADISSMNLFFYLAKNLKDSTYPMVLIGSFRPQDVKDGRLNPISGEMERHPWEEKMNNLDRYDAAKLIEVSYLNQNQIGSYIDLQFPQNEFGAKFKDEIVNLTRGNSLFVRELLLNLEERKIIYEKDGTYFSDETLDLSTLPKTVSGVIKERFQRLSEDLQEVLQIASAQGSDFSLELIASILEVNNFKLSKKINTLQQKYSLVLKSETVYDKLKKIYNFTHNLVQKYIYYQMTEDFRLDLHSALVETLESFFEGDEIYKIAEPYSYHFGIANGIIDENGKLIIENNFDEESLQKYLEFQNLLAEKFKNNYQNEEALEKFFKIIELAKLLSDKKNELNAKLEISQVFGIFGNLDNAISFCEKVIKKSRKLGLKIIESDSLIVRGRIYIRQGFYDESMDCYQQSLEIKKNLGDLKAVAKILSYIGRIYAEKGYYNEALEFFSNSIKAFEEIGKPQETSFAYIGMGNIYRDKGDYDKALEFYNKLLEDEKMRKNGNAQSVILNIGNIHYERGEYEEAIKCYNQVWEFSKKTGHKRGIAMAKGNLGYVYVDQTLYGKAIEYGEEYLKISQELGEKVSIGYAYSLLGTIYFRLEKFEKAFSYQKKRLAIFEEIGFKIGIGNALVSLGSLYPIFGDYEKAIQHLLRALKIVKEIGDKKEIANIYGYLAAIYSDKGDYAKAMSYFNKELKILEELDNERNKVTCLSRIGNVHLLKGEFNEAKYFFQECIKILEQFNAPADISVIWGKIGRIHIQEGNFEEAQNLFEKGLDALKNSPKKYNIAEICLNKAKLLFQLKDYEKSQKANDECLTLFKKVGRKDKEAKQFLFESNILSLKLNFILNDKVNPPQELLEMLSQTKDEEEKATLNYELWKMTSEEKYKIEASKLYQELYSKIPNFEYKKRIEELSQT
ncbi:MAG: tetratricopeptide repeat protein [Calditrichaeota bacterium]|nr:MAG: tetratricopeptide repeat protein [Calditrichota bacterium]